MKKLLLLSLLMLSSTSFVLAGLNLEEDGEEAHSTGPVSKLSQEVWLALRHKKVPIKSAIRRALEQQASDDLRSPLVVAECILSSQFKLPNVWHNLSECYKMDLLGFFLTPSWLKPDQLEWRRYEVKDYRETDALFSPGLKERFNHALKDEPLFLFRVAGGGDCGAYALQLSRQIIIEDVISLAHNDEIRRLLAAEIAYKNEDYTWVGNGQAPLPSIEEFINYVRSRYGDDEDQLREILDTPILIMIARKYDFSLYIWTCQNGSKKLSLVAAHYDANSKNEKHMLLEHEHYSNLLTGDATQREVYVAAEIEDACVAMDYPLSERQYRDAFQIAKVKGLKGPFFQRFDIEDIPTAVSSSKEGIRPQDENERADKSFEAVIKEDARREAEREAQIQAARKAKAEADREAEKRWEKEYMEKRAEEAARKDVASNPVLPIWNSRFELDGTGKPIGWILYAVNPTTGPTNLSMVEDYVKVSGKRNYGVYHGIDLKDFIGKKFKFSAKVRTKDFRCFVEDWSRKEVRTPVKPTPEWQDVFVIFTAMPEDTLHRLYIGSLGEGEVDVKDLLLEVIPE